MGKQTLLCMILTLLCGGEPAARGEGPPVHTDTKTAEAPAGLLEALKDKDPSVRLQAAEVLVQMGDSKTALPVVEELLKSPQQAIRLGAGLLLKQMRPARLTGQLKDPDPSARLQAARALWQMGGAEAKSATPVLAELLKSRRPELRLSAALTLTQRSVPEAKAAVGVLVEALKDPQARVRLQAVQRLQQIAAPEVRGAVSVLVDLLRSHQREFGFQPAMLLGQMRPADLRVATPALLEALKDRNPSIRFQAALILARMGKAETAAAVPVLIDLLATDVNLPRRQGSPMAVRSPYESKSGFRLPVVQALVKIGPAAKAAIPSLVKLLDDAQSAPAAALALRQIGPDAVQPILETWSKQESFDRPGVIGALARFGPKARPAAGKLIEALTSQDTHVRELASNALAQIGGEAVPALEEALAQPDAHLRQASAAVLGEIGPAAENAIPALTRALRDSEVSVRVQAAQALWQVEHRAEKVFPSLLEGLTENNVPLRRSSARLLAEIEGLPAGSVPALRAALKDQDPIVRVNVAACLCGVVGHAKETVPVLVTALKIRPVRSQAIGVLGKAGPEAKQALPALLTELQDDKTDYALAGRIGSVVGQIAGSDGVESLLQALASASKRRRPLVVEALSQAGPAGFPCLLKLLDDQDSAVRAVAVRSLGLAGRRMADTVPALVNALQDRDAQVRREALRALGQVGSSVAAVSGAIPVLAGFLKGEQAEERILAAETLVYVEPRGRQAVSILVEMARTDNLGLRRQAIAALGRIAEHGGRSTEPSSLRVRRALLSEKALLPVLAESLDSPDATLRLEAALALAQVGAAEARSAEREAPSAAPGAPGAVSEAQNPPRSALQAPLAQRVRSVLLEVVRERNHPLRTRAMEALTGCGAGEEEAVVSALKRALGDDRPARVTAALVLGKVGPLAKSAAGALTDLVNGPDPEARIQAALALWRIDHQAEAIPVLISELRSSVAREPGRGTIPARPTAKASMPTVPPCHQAALALGVMGPAARAAGPALTKLLSDYHFSSCFPYYALALARIDPQAAGAAVPALIAVLNGKPDAVHLPEAAAAALRRQAAKALGEIGPPAHAAVPSLRKALSDMDEAVRSEASGALKKIGD